MATIAPGYTWGAGEEVNGPNLTTLVAGAKISGIARSEIDSSAKVWFTGSPSSPQSGDHRYDASDGLVKVYDGADWNPTGKGFIATNAMAGQLDKGTVVILTGASTPTVTPTATQYDTRVVGVAIADIAGGADGIILTGGFATVLCNPVGGSTDQADGMGSATATGHATGRLTTNSEVETWGYFLQTVTVSGLATCFLMR